MLMRRRLYFVLPDVASARSMLNEMLLARIEVKHIHFLSRRDTLPEDLPEANVLQKTDIVHGAQMGIGIGGIVGAVAGALVVFFPPEGVTLKLVANVLRNSAPILELTSVSLTFQDDGDDSIERFAWLGALANSPLQSLKLCGPVALPVMPT